MQGASRFSRRVFLAAGIAWPAKGSMIEGQEVVAVRGAVATEPADAVRAGARILEAGGNAMDAAAAACLTSGILQPEASDIGGYVLCAVVLEGSSGRVWSLDANSAAPAAARDGMYQVGPLGAEKTGINANEYKCSVKDDANVFGPLAVGVPGVLAGVGTLWEKWGRLKWPQICAPAQRLLAEGFPYTTTAEAIGRTEKQIRKFEATARHLMPEGKVPKAEDRWFRTDLAKTFARLASAGWRDFYEGELGRKIADHIRGSGGILTRKDLSSYQPRLTEANLTTYRGAKVYGAALPNGGLSCLQLLNMLECFPALPDTDPIYWHRLAETFKLGWRDRLRYFGDPAFAKVATERFLSKDYAAGQVETLRKYPEQVDREPGAAAGASPGTVTITAGDREGNLVALTMSHGGLFGSCVTVPGTGIILGHGMCRFDPHPGLPNSVAGGKRPLNNVAPTIMRLPDRDVALGLRGGRRIVSVATQLAQRVVDSGVTGRQAAEAPRMHLEGHEPVEVMESLDGGIVKKLIAMGHDVKRVAGVGGHAHVVELLRQQHKIRAGGNVWAAGVE
jgi:gamma-glutamyltranspeptidase/glutathione hydrolase